MKTHSKIHLGHIVTILVMLSYFSFFDLKVIPAAIRIMAPLLTCGLMLAMIIIKIIYSPSAQIRMNFSTPVFLLMAGTIPSYFISRSYYNQSFVVSLYANSGIWFYLLYFFVHIYRVQVRFILRMIILVGVGVIGLYIIQYISFPTLFMDIHAFEDRGTVRLLVEGMLCTQVAYFYFLNQFFSKNRPVYLILSLLSVSVFVLQGTRQLIFAFLFLTLLNLLLARKIRSRSGIIVIVLVAISALFFVFREIFLELTRVTTNQLQHAGSNIRVQTTKYYLTEFMPGFWAYVFGNGNSALGSAYNQQLTLNAARYGYYLADIGVLGDYFKFGIVFTLAGLYMVAKGIFFKVSRNLQFFKFYILTQCFTLLTGLGIFAGVDVILLLGLYIFDVDRAETLQDIRSSKAASTSHNPESDDLTDETGLEPSN